MRKVAQVGSELFRCEYLCPYDPSASMYDEALDLRPNNDATSQVSHQQSSLLYESIKGYLDIVCVIAS